MKAIEAGIFTETTGNRLKELEADRNELLLEIEKEEILRPVISKEQVIFFLNRFKNGDVKDKKYQQQIIDLFVNKIYLYDDKIIIIYNYSGDNNEVSADIVEQAALDAEFECSDTVTPPPPK